MQRSDAHAVDDEGTTQATQSLVRSSSDVVELSVEQATQAPSSEVRGSSVLVSFQLKSLSIEFIDENLYDNASYMSTLGLKIEVQQVESSLRTHTDQERFEAGLTVLKFEVTETTQFDEFSKIAFWHKKEESLAAASHVDNDYQMSARVQVRLGKEEDKYRPGEDAFAEVLDAQVNVRLNHSIVCLNMLLIQKLIINANHAYQLHKDSFAKKSDITNTSMQESIKSLQERNEMKSLGDRQRQVIVKRYDNLAQLLVMQNNYETEAELDAIIELCIAMLQKHGN